MLLLKFIFFESKNNTYGALYVVYLYFVFVFEIVHNMYCNLELLAKHRVIIGVLVDLSKLEQSFYIIFRKDCNIYTPILIIIT